MVGLTIKLFRITNMKTFKIFFSQNVVVYLFLGIASVMTLGYHTLYAQDKKPAPKKEEPKKEEPKKDDKKTPPKPVDPNAPIEIKDAVAPVNVAKGTGPSFPGNDPAFLVLPKRVERSNMARELLTPEIVEMTNKCLQYLADSQAPNGSWSDMQYKSNSGVTALCCLAFMAEGSRPRVGKYGKHLDKGLDFLLANVQGNGVIAAEGNNPLGAMYEHVLSSMALMFSYGDMPWRPQLQDVLAKSIQILTRSQKIDGGWRYDIAREGYADMSVTANVLWLLRTGKKAGFTVSQEQIKKGVDYIVKCAYPDGTFRYRYFGLHASASLGGTGIIAVSNNGNLNHPLIGPARDRLDYDYKRYTIQDLLARRYYVYGCFYASVAMYSTGDEYWNPWYQKATQVLKTMQRKDGEMWDEFDNTIYPTAMAAIVLLAPKGYLPIYER